MKEFIDRPFMKLYHADCFDVFPQLEDKSIDLVLCDMPYGTTACKWDTVIDLERMWEELKRIVKDNTAIVFTASQPFTSVLVCSNLKGFKYQWYWKKSRPTGFANAKKQPLRQIEDIVVFYRQQAIYNPQGVIYNPKTVKNSVSTGGSTIQGETIGTNMGAMRTPGNAYIQEYTNYPRNIIEINSEVNTRHPTQKPIALMEYLIKTYSNEGDTVLDFCMGSGTTGVACKDLNREFIGIEKEDKYYQIAKERMGLL